VARMLRRIANPPAELGEPAPGEPTATVSAARFILTWPRALLFAAALVLFAGGRGAWFLLALLAATLWASSHAVTAGLRGLRLGWRLLEDRAFAGGEARVQVRVHNPGRWPVPLLLLETRLPDGLHGSLRRLVTLPGRGTRGFELRIGALRRGAYRLGELRLSISDWLGLFEERALIPARTRLVVYPAPVPLPDLPLRRRLPTGPHRDPPSPFRDDLPAGVRPYVRGDPLAAVAWKASARRGELVVRDFPPVRDTTTWVFLDLCSEDWEPRQREPLCELAIAAAAAFVRREHAARRPVGLCTWAAEVEVGLGGPEARAGPAWLRLPARADPGQPRRLLDLLATVRHAPGGDFAGRLTQEARALPWGARAIVLVPRDTPEVWGACAAPAARGHPVTILCFERRLGRPAGLDGLRLPEVLEVSTRDGIAYR
jgi:uncharacterized protein (DUF58 family)